LAYAEWLKHNSNSYGDAVTDDFHTNNDAAISKLEDTVRELETRHEMLDVDCEAVESNRANDARRGVGP
jgi:hypothetical protein